MTKLTNQHLFNAGARLARGAYPRKNIGIKWGNELSLRQQRQVLAGFDAEAVLIVPGNISARSGRPFGKA